VAKIEITKTEFVWPGKYGLNGQRWEVERGNLPLPDPPTMPSYSHCMFEPGSGHPKQDAFLFSSPGLYVHIG
jgi:hypothetical protein